MPLLQTSGQNTHPTTETDHINQMQREKLFLSAKVKARSGQALTTQEHKIVAEVNINLKKWLLQESIGTFLAMEDLLGLKTYTISDEMVLKIDEHMRLKANGATNLPQINCKEVFAAHLNKENNSTNHDPDMTPAGLDLDMFDEGFTGGFSGGFSGGSTITSV